MYCSRTNIFIDKYTWTLCRMCSISPSRHNFTNSNTKITRVDGTKIPQTPAIPPQHRHTNFECLFGDVLIGWLSWIRHRSSPPVTHRTNIAITFVFQRPPTINENMNMVFFLFLLKFRPSFVGHLRAFALVQVSTKRTYFAYNARKSTPSSSSCVYSMFPDVFTRTQSTNTNDMHSG